MQINWHDTKPVLTLDFHPISGVLATGGADFDIKVSLSLARSLSHSLTRLLSVSLSLSLSLCPSLSLSVIPPRFVFRLIIVLELA